MTPSKKSSKKPFRDRVLDRAMEYLRDKLSSSKVPALVHRVANG
jgi:hypothetical protein